MLAMKSQTVHPFVATTNWSLYLRSIFKNSRYTPFKWYINCQTVMPIRYLVLFYLCPTNTGCLCVLTTCHCAAFACLFPFRAMTFGCNQRTDCTLKCPATLKSVPISFVPPRTHDSLLQHLPQDLSVAAERLPLLLLPPTVAFNFSCSEPPKTLPLVCLLSSFIIIMYFSVSVPAQQAEEWRRERGRGALAALYLTLGSLMAGNRILMDFVISSTTTKTLPFLWVRTRSVFIFILSFALLLAYFSAVYLGKSRVLCY